MSQKLLVISIFILLFHISSNAQSLLDASKNGNIEIVKELLNEGAKVDTSDEYGTTPLMFAAFKGHTEIVNLLLTHGANINLQNNNGVTPLINVAGSGHPDIAKILIKNGAELNTKMDNGYTALMLAAKNENLKTLKVLIDAGAKIDARENNHGMTALMDASRDGKTDVVKILLTGGSNVNLQDNIGLTALFFASMNNHADIVKILIDARADVDAEDEDGSTPLLFVTDLGYNEVVKTLLENGANVNSKNKRGQTPLIIAAGKGHINILQTLLDYGADLNDEYNGKTAFMWARDKGNREIAHILEDAIQVKNQKSRHNNLKEITVYQAQNILKNLGYDPGPIDGQWGKKTEKALSQFQYDNGLSLTNKLDENTKKRLRLQKVHLILVPWDKLSECDFIRERTLLNKLKLSSGRWKPIESKYFELATGLVRGGIYDAIGIGTYLEIGIGEQTDICNLNINSGSVFITRRGFEFKTGSKFEVPEN